MTWFYGLAAECGSDRASAERLATLALAREPDWTARVVTDASGAVWASVYLPLGPAQAARAYTLLRLTSGYRFALVGPEVERFRTYADLLAAPDDVALFPGLVVAEATHAALGAPPGFSFFAPGYRIQP